MDNLTTSSPKNITQPLFKFLEILWGSRDRAYTEDDLALLIKTIDNDEQFCHVEANFADKEKTIITSYAVWRIKDWKADIEYHNRVKLQSEIDRQKRFRRDELILLLAQNLLTMFPDLGMNERTERATHYVMTKNTKICKLMGVDITELV